MHYVFHGSALPDEARVSLTRQGFECCALPPFQKLDPGLDTHPDMLFLCLGERLFVHSDYLSVPGAGNIIFEISERKRCKTEPTIQPMGPVYPDDILFNILVIGKHLVGRLDSVSKKVLFCAKDAGYELHSVRQGYARCTTCVLSDEAAVTQDPGISALLRELKIDVLQVDEKDILLPGFDHGFIGGASGKFMESVYFTGDLSRLAKGGEIAAFCQKHGIKPVSLTQERLVDCGGLFFV